MLKSFILNQKVFLILTMSILFPQSSKAIELTPEKVEVTLRGHACESHKTSVNLTPDNSVLSLLFDEFSSQVPNLLSDNDNDETSEDNPQATSKSNLHRNHKVCWILIKAQIPQNHQLQKIEISFDFRGYSQGEVGTNSQFKSLFIHQKGLGRSDQNKKVLIQKSWPVRNSNRIEEEWTLQNEQTLPINGGCAKNQDKAIEVALKNILISKILPQYRNQTPLPSASLTLDTTDINLGLKKRTMKIKLKLKKCGAQ
jgi:hypothetical protein